MTERDDLSYFEVVKKKVVTMPKRLVERGMHTDYLTHHFPGDALETITIYIWVDQSFRMKVRKPV